MKSPRLGVLLLVAAIIAVVTLVTGLFWIEGESGSHQRAIPLPPPDQNVVSRTPAGEPQNPVELAILRTTNQERRELGLSDLLYEETLGRIAANHSRDMLDRGFFDHDNPDLEGPTERVARQHRRLVGTIGENIASIADSRLQSQDLGREFVANWMHSPGHRANILHPRWNAIGIGVWEQDGSRMATQVFAEVQGYLRKDLPAVVDFVPLIRFDPLVLVADVVQFDLSFSPTGKSAWGPFSIDAPEPDRPSAQPGVYFLRVHVPRGAGRFAIYSGPSLTIKTAR